MKNDFISIFKTFEPSEKRAFHHYVQGLYGKQKAILDVLNQVMPLEKFEDDKLDIVGSSAKNTLNAFSNLKTWVLEFLALQEMKANSIDAKFLTLEALRKRKIVTVYQQKSNQLKKELDDHAYPTMWHLLWRLRLSHINYFNVQIDKLKDYKPYISNLIDDLDSFYIATKFKYSSEIQSRIQILGEEYDVRLLNEVLLVAENDESLSPSIKNLYLPQIQLTKDKSENAFLILKDFLINTVDYDSIERLSILLYLLNFAIHRIGVGQESYIREYFDLANFGIEESIFTASDYFPNDTFLNIVNTGCQLKKYGWLDTFIEKYACHLKYENVIELLQKIPNKNIAFNLNYRILLARAYYECEEEQALLSYCEALYLYIYRTETIGDRLKIRAENFVHLLERLVKKRHKAKLINELNDKQNSILCYDWLKAKIEALP
jgi:hypothetical protein